MRIALKAERGDVLARELPGWMATAFVVGAIATLAWLERRRPLRRRVDRALDHDARNAVVAVASGVAIRLLEKPLTRRLASFVQRRRLGIVKMLALPPAIEVVVAVVLLDYTLYVWHVLVHRVPGLWRFHRVHHADLDLTVSTALRFHFAEMIASIPWRLSQILWIGAAPLSLAVWQTATLVAIAFHHSNVALPIRIERSLCRWVMTPRMHGIHHSIVPEETSSNWSTIFAFPDYLHRTLRLNVPQQAVTIGVPEYREPRELTAVRLMAMPFRPQTAPGKLPDGREPERDFRPVTSRATLAE